MGRAVDGDLQSIGVAGMAERSAGAGEMSEPTRDQMVELQRLAARMSRDSRWAVTEAAFRLGMRLAAVQILGPACPCACGQELWHQRGVCREGQAMLMQ